MLSLRFCSLVRKFLPNTLSTINDTLLIFSGDPLSNLEVQFGSKEEAITYCERNGWTWYVDGDLKPKKERVKNYGVNFSWNKRTRVSTK